MGFIIKDKPNWKKYGILDMVTFEDINMGQTALRIVKCEAEYRPLSDDYFLITSKTTIFLYLPTDENINYFQDKALEVIDVNLSDFSKINIVRDDGSKYIGYQHEDYWEQLMKQRMKAK